jgi:FMN reductase
LLLCGRDIDLPAYVPGATSNARANGITAELVRADGIILGTPGYHGGLSGLVKNALDYTEDLRSNKRPYLEDRPVGCVVTAAGEQLDLALRWLTSAEPTKPRNRYLPAMSRRT